MNTIKQDVQETEKRAADTFGRINLKNTFLIATALLALLALAAPSTVHADTITHFNVTGTFEFSAVPDQSFGDLSLINMDLTPNEPDQSFVTIDTSTGLATGGILALTSLEALTVSPSTSPFGFAALAPNHSMSFSNPDGFIGFTGGPVQVRYNIDESTVFSNIKFTTAYLTPVPEPATIYMLGLGLLSLMGMILLRKRVA
jgi:hypothetical protein